MGTHRDDPGHEPEHPRDEEFAPVVQGGNAAGRTTPEQRGADRSSGTGVPGARSDHPDTLPPDEAGVRDAERADETRPDRGRRR